MGQIIRRTFRPLYDYEVVIKDDLAFARIDIKTGELPKFVGDTPHMYFPPVSIYAELHGITFRRTKECWLANGPIPLSIVSPFYEEARDEVRVDNLSHCPPPDKEYIHKWIHAMDYHFGSMDLDGVIVVRDADHRHKLKERYPHDEWSGECWYKFVPAGTHLKDGCVQLLGIYTLASLRSFAEVLVAHNQTATV